MSVKSIKILFFYILFTSLIIFFTTVENIFWNYLNTYYNKLIKIDQSRDNYSLNCSAIHDRVSSSYLINDSNYDFEYSSIARKFNNFYFKASKYYIKKRKIVTSSQRKWKFPIVYEIEKGKFNETLIDKVISNIQSETCIQFVKRKGRNIQNYPVLKYFSGYTCTSPYGRTKNEGVQSIMLTKSCQKWKSVMHETLHAMGLLHEQSRKDRDKYITINWTNILEGSQRNFLITTSLLQSTYNVTYDYGSIMHYDVNAFSKNNMATIIPKESIYSKTLGSSLTATFNDFKILNLHYCKHKCKNTIQCENGGYQNPNNCNDCKCPDGFQGKKCDKKSMDDNDCDKTYTADNSIGKITVNGSETCIFHINVTENEKIEINLFEIKFPELFICKPYNCLEIKYKSDLTVTGARICKTLQNYALKSEGPHIIIFYRSTSDTNSAKILFRIYKGDNQPWEESDNI